MALYVYLLREGLKVVLMHERPVLGGNASSEIRMWICGANGADNRETGILEEIALENLYRNPTKSYAVWDTVLYDFVHREKNITLLLNCTLHGRGCRARVVRPWPDRTDPFRHRYQMTTQRFYEVEAAFYSDCSGDSILAPLCGAHFRMGREAGAEFEEDTSVHTGDSMTMGMSCLIQGRETNREIKYIPPEWSKKLTGRTSSTGIRIFTVIMKISGIWSWAETGIPLRIRKCCGMSWSAWPQEPGTTSRIPENLTPEDGIWTFWDFCPENGNQDGCAENT